MKVPREVTIERERRAWELRQQLWTHARIAADLGVDESTVSRILARLSKRYGERHAEEIDALKGEQIAQLWHIADEAYQAWERSKQDAVTTTTKTVTVPQPDITADEIEQILADAMQGTELTKKVTGQSGSPAFLAEARAALADIRKIVGADAPTKLSDPNGDPLDLIKVYIGVDLEKV